MDVRVEICDGPLGMPETFDRASGGVVRFTGVVRDTEDGAPADGLTYEAYRPMAENQIAAILRDLGERHPIRAARVQHRTGFVPAGEAAVIVEILAAHRAEAFAVAQEFLDRLKRDVPIWKVGVTRPARRAIPSDHAPSRQAPARAMEIEDLWREIDRLAIPLPAERIDVGTAAGRTLAAAAVARVGCPPFDASAMDGYAFAELSPGACRIVGESAAGAPFGGRVGPGEAVRIFTGAVLPEGASAVAKQEDCRACDGTVRLAERQTLEPGEWIRRKNAIFREGHRLVPEGATLGAGSVALLVSAGVASVGVRRAPTVAHAVTGDELADVAGDLVPGAIFDSNGPMVRAIVAGLGCRVRGARLADRADAIDAFVAECRDDLLLVSGGSGPGDRDHTPGALERGGWTIHVDRINSRPGKPLIFATRGSQIAFGLPGNPLSHWVCMHAFVRRAVCRMAGRPAPGLEAAAVVEAVDDPGDGRRTWTPGVAASRDARVEVRPLPWKHSGDLTPLAHANCLILDLPPKPGSLARILRL